MATPTKLFPDATDQDLLNELGRRGYKLINPDRKKDREMAVEITSITTGESTPMRKLSLLCPQGSPLWWKEK